MTGGARILEPYNCFPEGTDICQLCLKERHYLQRATSFDKVFGDLEQNLRICLQAGKETSGRIHWSTCSCNGGNKLAELRNITASVRSAS